MKLEKAIVLLQDHALTLTLPHNLDLHTSIHLGIEALKERQEAINQGLPLWHELLPGETEK